MVEGVFICKLTFGGHKVLLICDGSMSHIYITVLEVLPVRGVQIYIFLAHARPITYPCYIFSVPPLKHRLMSSSKAHRHLNKCRVKIVGFQVL